MNFIIDSIKAEMDKVEKEYDLLKNRNCMLTEEELIRYNILHGEKLAYERVLNIIDKSF